MTPLARTRQSLNRAANRVAEILRHSDLPAGIRGLADHARRDLIDARRALPDEDAEIECELTPREQALADAAEAERVAWLAAAE